MLRNTLRRRGNRPKTAQCGGKSLMSGRLKASSVREIPSFGNISKKNSESVTVAAPQSCIANYEITVQRHPSQGVPAILAGSGRLGGCRHCSRRQSPAAAPCTRGARALVASVLHRTLCADRAQRRGFPLTSGEAPVYNAKVRFRKPRACSEKRKRERGSPDPRLRVGVGTRHPIDLHF